MAEPGEDGLLEGVFESAAIGLVVIDIAGRIVVVNPFVRRVMGYEDGALIGASFAEFLHPEDVSAATASLVDLMAGRVAEHRSERRFLDRAGGIHWTRITATRRTHRGAPVVVAVVEDFTEQRAINHALGERVKELTALHRTARVMYDAARTREDRLEEIVRLLPPAMQHPQITTGCVRVGDRRFETPGHAPTPWMLSAPFLCADGVVGEVEVAYREAQGGADGPFLPEESLLLASLADMIRGGLDRDFVERDLRKLAERLSLGLDAAGMAVWEWDLDRGVVRWSEQLAAMVGYTGPLEFPFGTMSKATHPEDRAHLAERLLAVAERGEVLEAIEVRHLRPDGTWREVMIHARPAPGRRVVAAIVDVSARAALEAGLRQAQKVDALGRVAGGVAHDFNNMLAVITATVDVLRDELPLEHPHREMVDDIAAAARTGVGLTRQLLAFSRSGTFQPCEVDLNALVLGLEPLLARLAGKQVALVITPGPAIGRTWADPTQLEQVVMNLVINARDAMPEGGTLDLTIAPCEVDGRRHVGLTVRDSGEGIPAALHARIFEPFFTTREPGKGTGLGLAVAAKVVKQWEGQISLESEVGKGTAFHVALPRIGG